MKNSELKEAYKHIKFSMGIFQIRNIQNDKILVDSSNNLDKIWNRHRMQLNFGGHPNIQLQKDWSELGEDNFKFEILNVLEQEENSIHDPNNELKILKKLFLEELQPFGEKGYN